MGTKEVAEIVRYIASDDYMSATDAFNKEMNARIMQKHNEKQETK